MATPPGRYLANTISAETASEDLQQSHKVNHAALLAVKNLSLHNTSKGELGHARGARAVAAAGVARDELRRNARPLGGNKNELVARVGKIRGLAGK